MSSCQFQSLIHESPIIGLSPHEIKVVVPVTPRILTRHGRVPISRRRLLHKLYRPATECCPRRINAAFDRGHLRAASFMRIPWAAGANRRYSTRPSDSDLELVVHDWPSSGAGCCVLPILALLCRCGCRRPACADLSRGDACPSRDGADRWMRRRRRRSIRSSSPGRTPPLGTGPSHRADHVYRGRTIRRWAVVTSTSPRPFTSGRRPPILSRNGPIGRLLYGSTRRANVVRPGLGSAHQIALAIDGTVPFEPS